MNRWDIFPGGVRGVLARSHAVATAFRDADRDLVANPRAAVDAAPDPYACMAGGGGNVLR